MAHISFLSSKILCRQDIKQWRKILTFFQILLQIFIISEGWEKALRPTYSPHFVPANSVDDGLLSMTPCDSTQPLMGPNLLPE